MEYLELSTWGIAENQQVSHRGLAVRTLSTSHFYRCIGVQERMRFENLPDLSTRNFQLPDLSNFSFYRHLTTSITTSDETRDLVAV